MPEQRDHEGQEDSSQQIHVGETAEGRPVWLPVERILTGRAFVTGKSGSGKSNTASVVIEELLERRYPVLIVDTDGEYYGLKEEYELLHAGADEECDIQVSAEHAEKLAELALEQNVPIILDVSGYLDEDEASSLIRETARHLFAKEKKLKKPFLLVVEEVHEYIPEGAGIGETGKMLIKVGKRGRKHGLGILGISQRPADVKKDFITQANWLVWHRLTWDNDTKVVRRIVGGEYGDRVSDLDAGEAFVQLDWTDEDVHHVQFKRKRTFDAGATPGLEDFERPELKSVSDALVDDLAEITDAERREQDRIEELEAKLERRENRIDDLEDELEQARNVSTAAEQVAEAVAEDVPAGFQARLATKNDEIERLHDRVADLERDLERLAGAVAADGPDEATLRAFESDESSRSGPKAGADETPADEPPTDGTTEGDDEATDEEVAEAADEATDEEVAEAADGTTDEEVAETADGGEGAAETDARRESDPSGGDDATADDRTDRPDLFADYRSIDTYLEAARDGRDRSAPPAWVADGTPGEDEGGENGSGPEDPTASGEVVFGAGADAPTPEGGAPAGERVGSDRETASGETTPDEDTGSDGSDAGTEPEPDIAELLRSDPVAVKLRAAVRHARCNESDAKTILASLAAEGPKTVPEAASTADTTPEAAHSLLSALRARNIVDRGAGHRYALDRAGMVELVETADEKIHLGEGREQWVVDVQ